MATITDVARAAQFSTTSVSRVLAGHENASAEMRKRVLAAAKSLDFRPRAVVCRRTSPPYPQPDGSQVVVDSRPVRIHTTARTEAFGIATIHQEFDLVPQLSVAEMTLGAVQALGDRAGKDALVAGFDETDDGHAIKAGTMYASSSRRAGSGRGRVRAGPHQWQGGREDGLGAGRGDDQEPSVEALTSRAGKAGDPPARHGW